MLNLKSSVAFFQKFYYATTLDLQESARWKSVGCRMPSDLEVNASSPLFSSSFKTCCRVEINPSRVP